MCKKTDMIRVNVNMSPAAFRCKEQGLGFQTRNILFFLLLLLELQLFLIFSIFSDSFGTIFITLSQSKLLLSVTVLHFFKPLLYVFLLECTAYPDILGNAI